jgi:hypothetical protein
MHRRAVCPIRPVRAKLSLSIPFARSAHPSVPTGIPCGSSSERPLVWKPLVWTDLRSPRFLVWKPWASTPDTRGSHSAALIHSTLASGIEASGLVRCGTRTSKAPGPVPSRTRLSFSCWPLVWFLCPPRDFPGGCVPGSLWHRIWRYSVSSESGAAFTDFLAAHASYRVRMSSTSVSSKL